MCRSPSNQTGLAAKCGKARLVCEKASKNHVIANQSADWCGNPFPPQWPGNILDTDCHVAARLAMTYSFCGLWERHMFNLAQRSCIVNSKRCIMMPILPRYPLWQFCFGSWVGVIHFFIHLRVAGAKRKRTEPKFCPLKRYFYLS